MNGMYGQTAQVPPMGGAGLPQNVMQQGPGDIGGQRDRITQALMDVQNPPPVTPMPQQGMPAAAGGMPGAGTMPGAAAPPPMAGAMPPGGGMPGMMPQQQGMPNMGLPGGMMAQPQSPLMQQPPAQAPGGGSPY